MSFYCECDSDYDHEFSTVSRPKARKEHRCEECGHTITPGQVYRREAGKVEGYMYTHVMCERCDDLAAAFADVGYSWNFGDFFSSYTEWLIESAGSEMAAREAAEEKANAIRLRHRTWAPSSASN